MATIVQQTNGEKTIYTADEYTLVNQKLGDLTKLSTSDKTSVVNAINGNAAQLADIVHNIENYPIQVPETDDTARIKRALADLVSFGGGILLIPKMYQVSDTIEITNSNIHLLGNGHQTGFTQNTSGKMTVYIHTSGISNIKLENFCVNANMHGQEDVGAITIYDVLGFVVENVEVKNTPIRVNGISVSQVNTYGVVRDCHVHDCGKGGIYAATSTAYMVIENNNIHDITNVGQTDKEGGTSFDIPAIQVIGGSNVKITNNRCYNATSSGIYFMTGSRYATDPDIPLNNLIQGNTCFNNKQGIYLSNAYTTDTTAEETRAIISSNHCFNNTDSGIRVDNRNLISLESNHCFDNANGTNGIGIEINSCQHVGMNGNHCFDNPYSGIQLNGVTHLTMTNNQAYVYNGTQTRGLTFAGTVSDTINMGFNDFNNILTFTAPTNVKAMYNNPDTLDLMLASTKSASPTTLKNGQIWYDSPTNTLKVVINGAVKTFTVA